MPKTVNEIADLLDEAANDLEALQLPENAIFAMSSWGTHFGSHHPKENNYCGTAACAAGWLSLTKKWYDRGMTSHWQATRSIFDKTITDYFLVAGKKGNADWEGVTYNTFGTVHPIFIFGKIRFNRNQVAHAFRAMAKGFREKKLKPHRFNLPSKEWEYMNNYILDAAYAVE